MTTRAESNERKAVHDAKKLIHISPKQAPKLLGAMSKTYRQQGQIGCALQARRYQCFAWMENLEYEKARDCLQLLFSEATAANEKRFIGIGEMYLGIIATENGEVDIAAECFDHAIRIGTEVNDTDLIHRVQINLGIAQLMMERYDEALESLNHCARTIEIGERSTNQVSLASSIAFARTHIAYRAALQGHLTPELLSQAEASLASAEKASRDDFRYETISRAIRALFTGLKDSPRAGLALLDKSQKSMFQKSPPSVSLMVQVIECRLYELEHNWPMVRKTAAEILRTMKVHRSLAQFRTVYSLAAKAHAEDGNYQLAYWLLQECSNYLVKIRNSTGLHGAYITNLRYSLEHQEMDQAILMMRNRNLMDRNEILERESRIDPLSGVLNRRGIEEVMKEYSEQRVVSKFAIGLLDIDFFKRVNDQYGHAVGDRVIAEFAKCLTQSSTNPAKIGRWGGEEFLVIFDIDQPEDMEALGEKLVEEIRRRSWNKIYPGLKMTASMGLAMWRLGESLDEITKRADQMLYAVKQNGRNSWQVATFDHAA